MRKCNVAPWAQLHGVAVRDVTAHERRFDGNKRRRETRSMLVAAVAHTLGSMAGHRGLYRYTPLPCSSLRILEITRGPRRPRQSAPLLCLAHAVATLF